jgi:chemotaxis response regulator CheB
VVTYRVLVVDDHKLWRDYFSSALRDLPQWRIIGEASDGLEAVQKAQELKPDLILLDVGLPTMDGIQAARRILANDPSSRILFVSEQRLWEVAEGRVEHRCARIRRQGGCRARITTRHGRHHRRPAFYQRKMGRARRGGHQQ